MSSPSYPPPSSPQRHREDKWELSNALQHWHNGNLLRKIKSILVTTNEIWCRTAIVSSGQMGRIHSGAASLQTSKTRWSRYCVLEVIPVLRTLLAFTAVTEMKRIIKSVAFVRSNANEEAALMCSLKQQPPSIHDWVSALNFTTKHPLGSCSFHLQQSILRLPLTVLLSWFTFPPLLCLLTQLLYDDTILKVV